jgi:hypothetical protein
LIHNKPGAASGVHHSLIRSAIRPVQEEINEQAKSLHQLQPC